MKNRYKFIYDSGEIYYEIATTKTVAIVHHCATYAVPKDWVLKHCKIINEGAVPAEKETPAK